MRYLYDSRATISVANKPGPVHVGANLMLKKAKGVQGNLAYSTRKTQKLDQTGTLWDFSTSILWKNSKKLKCGPFRDFFFEKSPNAEKTEEGLSFARYCMLCRKYSFWFISLGQQTQFKLLLTFW